VWPWMLWMEMWTRAAMLPLAVMAGTAPPAPRRKPETEEYMVRELREDLALQGIQGIIDEGGRG
jgi:hypothetical protein